MFSSLQKIPNPSTPSRSSIRSRHKVDSPAHGFVYELNSHRATVHPDDITTNIKPSVHVRAKHYPGNKADRPELDSFWCYMYHCVVDPCCGDLERVLYGRNAYDDDDNTDAGLFDEEMMVFFNAADHHNHRRYSDDDDDDDSDDLEEENFHDSSFESATPERKQSFVKSLSFRLGTLVEI